ncbi:MAG TPA: PIN domain-containing protein [Candidatus Bathyarchaeia archaeon]|nr:PIN domain-containing protein [Candidatus Bathyarchaeia archaeon]
MKEILDTRFFTEHFYSGRVETQQKTTRRLRELVHRNEGILPTIVISEVVQVTCEKRGRELAEARYHALIESGLQIETLTPTIARQAGIIKCQHKNIPMGDCIIAATAITNQARILTDDPHYKTIKETKSTWI